MTRSGPAALLLAIVVAYAVIGLVVLSPDAVYSGDIGVKYIQARALAARHFASLDLAYPGERIDPAREFFPVRPPFVMQAAGGTQTIFPPASSLMQGVVAGAGLRGFVALSLAGAAAILVALWRMTSGRERVLTLVALGIASPLWFYAVSGWEHAPAVAFGTAAFACAILAPAPGSTVIAGLLVGAGAAIRDEVLLVLPGMLFAIWLRTRGVRPVFVMFVSAAIPLVAAGALEVGWFGRPPAAHLRHAVHLAQKAAHLTSAPNPELPVRDAFTLRQRYETVVQYWLLGYGDNRLIAIFAATLAVALLVRWLTGSSVGLAVWLLGALALAALDAREVLTAPKWLAGLYRLSPFVVFACMPWPAGVDRRPHVRAAVLVTTLAYIAIAAAGADTTGGKSLGPRLLLPLLPLLTLSSAAAIVAYVRSSSRVDRLVGGLGLALIAVAAAIQVGGALPAYIDRNRADAAAIRAIGSASETWVVADEEFTAQLLLPLYYAKIVLLADTPELGRGLARRLDENRITRFVVVSRRSTAQMSMRPYDLERIEPAGRMSIQYWQR